MKLYVCWGTFGSPRPGGHPCRNAYEALREAGWDPEVEKTYGWGVLGNTLNPTRAQGPRADRPEHRAGAGDRRRRGDPGLEQDHRLGKGEPRHRVRQVARGAGRDHLRRAAPRRRELGPYSGQEASPVVAPRMTFRDSSAHLRRVGEISMPSWSITQSAPEPATSSTRHADQLLGGDRRRRLGDRAALAVEAQVGDLAVLHHDVHAQLVAAERVVVVPLEVVRLELPKFRGFL